MWDRVDLGALIGIISLVLAIPVGIMSHVLRHRFLATLEQRKLIKGNATDNKPFERIITSNHSTTVHEIGIPII